MSVATDPGQTPQVHTSRVAESPDQLKRTNRDITITITQIRPNPLKRCTIKTM